MRNLFACVLLSASILAAQVNLADVGYRIPSKLISAAPNQIVVLSFDNVSRRGSGPVNVYADRNGIPLQVNGLSIKVTDGSAKPLDVGFIAFQQTEGLNPVTSLTVLMPPQLAVNSSRWFDFTGKLTLFDNGAAIAEFPFRPVPDRIHFLNSCDESRISVGVLAGLPNLSDCFAVVINKDGVTTAANPVSIGDAVATYLYGLGAVELRDDPFGRFEPVQSLDLHFDYRPNAPGSRAVPGYGITGKPLLAVGAPGGGLYQVNFTVPRPPAGTILADCDGRIIRSNLTVTLSGSTSFDSASFCVRQ